MGLNRCRACGDVVSTLVNRCPGCGTAMPPRPHRPAGPGGARARRGIARATRASALALAAVLLCDVVATALDARRERPGPVASVAKSSAALPAAGTALVAPLRPAADPPAPAEAAR